MIVSPGFGERLDLKKHTRDLMNRISQELNMELEWIALAHFNTGHPHVHIALCRITQAGNLCLPTRSSIM
jgi:type IV secretory pathway VirD2 relaxase